jgi:hypothetical protein
MEQSSPSTLPDKRIPISRKKFKAMLMPKVGDMLCDNLFRVEYTNAGQFRFIASYRTVPPVAGHRIKIDDRLFEINRLNVVDKRFGAKFIGFDEPPIEAIPDAPEPEEDDSLVKLI